MHLVPVPRRPLRLHRTCIDWALVFLVLFAGIALVRGGWGQASGPPQPGPEAGVAPAATPAQPRPQPSDDRAEQQPGPSLKALPASAPVRVRIPSIRLDAPVTRVGLTEDGLIDAPPPEEKNLAGWYHHSPTPGENGTSVVVGHVDNRAGPAVFYHLGALRKNHTIRVLREDGSTAVFRIYGIEVFEKDGFPAERVYGDTGHPELRLMTCGGTYDEDSGYSGNVVVFARLTGPR